jgi:hypothetical protein
MIESGSSDGLVGYRHIQDVNQDCCCGFAFAAIHELDRDKRIMPLWSHRLEAE